MDKYWRPGGCNDQQVECKRLIEELDPKHSGSNDKVNDAVVRPLFFAERL